MTGFAASFIVRGSRLKIILLLALPIIIQSGSQSILTLVDTAMVGTLGDVALAAVGLSNYSYFVVTAMMSGLGMCAQIMTARRFGQGDNRGLAVPLNGNLFLGLAVAVPVTVLLFFWVPDFFPRLSEEPAVVASGVPYLQARILGVIGVVINFSYYGFLTGIGRTALCLKIGLIMQAFHVVLNYSLIFGHFGLPELGATGAGIGSTVSTFLGSALYTVVVFKLARANGFLRKLPDFATLRSMSRLAATSALTQLFFAAGIAALMWIVGQIGVRETAIANVLLNITMLMVLPCIGLGLAAASLVGQALGRADPADARLWGWQVARVGMLFMGVAALPLLITPDWILSLFLHDPVTRDMAQAALRMTGLMIVIDGFGIVILHALIGAGDTTRVMLGSFVLQWVLFLPLAWLLGPLGGFGITAVWLLLLAYRLINAMVFGITWRRGKWTRITL